jgi:hypothetical protein
LVGLASIEPGLGVVKRASGVLVLVTVPAAFAVEASLVSLYASLIAVAEQLLAVAQNLLEVGEVLLLGQFAIRICLVVSSAHGLLGRRSVGF